MKKDNLIDKAVFLRKKGYSINEISKDLKMSKSTASLWLRNIKISRAGLKRLEKNSNLGRKKGNDTNRKKRQDRWHKVADRTMNFRKNLSDYDVEKCKILLAMLYWGEGAKSGYRLTFINSDSKMIKVYLFLLRKSFHVNEKRLKATIHIHSYHDQEDIISYWQRITKISKNNFHIYRKSNSGKIIRKSYKGCISLSYGDVNVFDEIILIIDRMQNAIK
jgi:hypothetical protein